MIKAVLVDDEERSLENLTKLLQAYCKDVQIVAKANTVADAYSKIQEYKPNLVFLDIDMPPDTGFDLLRKYDELPFDVIFVTAYDYYAIDAIKFSALYYIMKPIKVEELKEAVAKAIKLNLKKNRVQTEFIKQLHPKREKLQRIVVNTVKESELIELENILYIEASNVYSTIYITDSKKIICSQRSIKDYEEMLTDKGFFRCHKSFLVNLHQIASLDKQEGSEIILKNKGHIPLARRRKEELMSLIGS
ncbi:MAG: LytR/AlgR family response regulator transcription factor [Chitinophagales bacterium]|jgi:two-component system LytT family response regulator|nr:LytTR family DNA-binding domain-containing protein [Sphingobacteriales bacterium]